MVLSTTLSEGLFETLAPVIVIPSVNSTYAPLSAKIPIEFTVFVEVTLLAVTVLFVLLPAAAAYIAVFPVPFSSFISLSDKILPLPASVIIPVLFLPPLNVIFPVPRLYTTLSAE